MAIDAVAWNKYQQAQVDVAINRYEKRFFAHLNSLKKDIKYYLADVSRIDNASKAKIDSIVAEIVGVQNTRYAAAVQGFTDDAALLASYVSESELIGLNMPTVAKDIAVIAARTPIAASGLLPAEHMQQLVNYNNKRLADTIRIGWANKTPIEDISALIIGTEKLRYSDGLIHKQKLSSRSAIDTASSHIVTTAKAETWKANDVYQYRVVATLDLSTTDICIALDGTVYTYGASNARLPPFHYFCRTVIVPELDKEYSWLSEGRTRSSMYGSVSSQTTYAEWAAQNADKIAEQNEIDRLKRNRRARARRKAQNT